MRCTGLDHGARKNLLEQADVIIYAGSLVNPELLGYARKDAKVYNSAYMTLEEVLAVIEDAEKEGLNTVRLHTGEPSIYGAVREQMDRLDDQGIAYESCPGVSACFWSGGRSESGIYPAGSVSDPHYHKAGGKDRRAGQRKDPESCGASGEHGNLSECRYVRYSAGKSDRRWLFCRYACGADP